MRLQTLGGKHRTYLRAFPFFVTGNPGQNRGTSTISSRAISVAVGSINFTTLVKQHCWACTNESYHLQLKVSADFQAGYRDITQEVVEKDRIERETFMEILPKMFQAGRGRKSIDSCDRLALKIPIELHSKS